MSTPLWIVFSVLLCSACLWVRDIAWLWFRFVDAMDAWAGTKDLLRTGKPIILSEQEWRGGIQWLQPIEPVVEDHVPDFPSPDWPNPTCDDCEWCDITALNERERRWIRGRLCELHR